MKISRSFAITLIAAGLLLGESAVAQQNTTVVQESTGAGTSAPAASVGAGMPLKMVGGGARTNWSGNGNLLTQTQPGAPGQNTWIGSGKDHLAASPATLTAYGVGLADPNDDWDVGVFLQTSALAAHPVATASLPAGYALTGGGCLVDWRASPSPMGNLLTASFPSSLTTWECRSKDHSVSSPAPITAFVVGIRPKKAGIALPTVQITTTTSAVTNHPTAVAPALSGWVLTGGGARALPADSAGAGQLLTGTFPTTAQGSQTPNGWYAAAKDHAVASPGTVQAFAVNVRFGAASAGGSAFTTQTRPRVGVTTSQYSFTGIQFEYDKAPSGTPPPQPANAAPWLQIPGIDNAGTSRQPLVSATGWRWNPGSILNVSMTAGTPVVRSKVKQFAREWSKFANVGFAFVEDNDPSAHIRVSFNNDGTSWSSIGRGALYEPFPSPTMNFGWFTDATTDTEFSRVVIHEFGHALGLLHEHQSPVGGMQWDRDKVYAFFAATQNPPWSTAQVDEQIFARYNNSSTNFSQYDPASIMHYGFPANLTLDNRGSPMNSSLSALDKVTIRQWYPFPSAVGGTIATGDDCDAISFKVDFNIMPADKIAFQLQPANGLTWWKAIEVPISGGRYLMLQMQDGRSDANVLDITSVDITRAIRVWKAKGLGVHTRLDYVWDAMSYLPGGSRVTLTWTRDHCS